MRSSSLTAGVLCVLSAATAGCAAQDVCPPFAHIVGGDFGRTDTSLWWTLQVEALPTELTFNQSAVPANFLEYRWAVDLDSDHDGKVDLRAAIEHFVTINAAPVTTGDILSQTSEDLWEVQGSLSTNVGSFTASIDAASNSFRFETTTDAAAGLATVTDRAQSTWQTVYRSGADPDDQCEDQLR